MAQNIPTDFNAADLTSLRLLVIQYTPVALANKLASFIAHGSKRHTLAPGDLRIEKSPNETPPDPMTFEWLISQGNRFFDSLFFVSIPVGDRPSISSVPDGTRPLPLTGQQVASALFYQYFFILTRGQTSESRSANPGADVPNFLVNVMGLSSAPYDYSRQLATFNLNKIDPSWAMHVPFADIGREAVSRFGLGVAGYRMLAPFKLLTPQPNLAPNLQQALSFARSMATAAYTWDIHSATRHPNILNQYGPLNANLGNLMLEVFSQADLNGLVTTRALFAMPIHRANYTNYRTWTGLYVPDPNRLIF